MVLVGKVGSYQFSLVFVVGSVFVVVNDGIVVCINVQNGQILWCSCVEGDLIVGVGSDGSIVVVVVEKGCIQVFDVVFGKLIWSVQVFSEVLLVLVVGEGLVVICSIDNCVIVYDVDNGSQCWMVQCNVLLLILCNVLGIVIGLQIVFVVLLGGCLLVLVLNNGGLCWEVLVGDLCGIIELECIFDVLGVLVLGLCDICVVLYQGCIGCFDLFNGNVCWIKEFFSDVGVNLDDVYVYVVDVNGVVIEFVCDIGVVIWCNDCLKNCQLFSLIVVGKVVVVVDFQGYIYFLLWEDGVFVVCLVIDGSVVQVFLVLIGLFVVF